MTRDEIGDMIAALPEGLEPDELIFKLVNWAVDKEREACAKVCLEGTGMPVQVDAIKIIRAERERISNAIRARGIDVAKVGEVGVWGDKREWVGLTDGEAKKTFEEHNCVISADLAGILARAIQYKLEEKNNG